MSSAMVVGYTGVVLPPPVVPAARPGAEPMVTAEIDWAKMAVTATRAKRKIFMEVRKGELLLENGDGWELVVGVVNPRISNDGEVCQRSPMLP